MTPLWIDLFYLKKKKLLVDMKAAIRNIYFKITLIKKIALVNVLFSRAKVKDIHANSHITKRKDNDNKIRIMCLYTNEESYYCKHIKEIKLMFDFHC